MTMLATCACCGDILAGRYDRRHFLQFAGAAGMAATFPLAALAQGSGSYEAMLLSCVDPRTQEPVRALMQKQGLIGKYSQFTIAGAAIGVVAPKFSAWQPAYWDNLAATVELHKINKVIAINHRDCGACRIAYGNASTARLDIEMKTHRRVFAQFREEMKKRQPKLGVETGLIALDGRVDMIA